MRIPLAYLQPMEGVPTYVVALLIFTPIAIGVGIFAYKTRHGPTWRKGIFPSKIKFNQDNLLEAYLALGAILVLFDYGKTKGKTQFINNYFNRYFKFSNYNFGDSLLFSMKYPIQIDTVCVWLNMHLKDEGEKAQVIYFLTGLALIKGTLTKKELAFLQLMNSKLGLSSQNLERIIAIYESYYANKKTKKGETTRKKSRPKIEYYGSILGVSAKSTLAEIKKAYRSLAKVHHPDVFANASDAQQKMAKEKFVKIQEAYEYLSERATT